MEERSDPSGSSKQTTRSTGVFCYSLFMSIKIKAVSLLIALVLVGAFVFRWSQKDAYEKVMVINTKGTACPDIYPPRCLGYDVIVKLEDGSEKTYKVPGTENGNNKNYDEISRRLNKVINTDDAIYIKVNAENEIISVK